MTYTAVVIEDDDNQREGLVRLLKETCPDVEVIGTASSATRGAELLLSAAPDLAFLDVLLPPDTSFDLLNTLPSIPFEVIFTTSFEEYAVKAFRLSAVDYLIKPVSRDALMLAMHRFKQRRMAKENVGHLRTLLDNMQVSKAEYTRIALPTLTGYIFVRIKDIIRCESDNTYTVFFTTDKKKIIVSKTLKDCEQILSDYRFYRVHNSHLINLDYIVEYTRGEGGVVHMTDGSQVDVSRRRKETFMQVLNRL